MFSMSASNRYTELTLALAGPAEVLIANGSESVEGDVVQIASDGHLQVKTGDGTVRDILVGDVSRLEG